MNNNKNNYHQIINKVWQKPLYFIAFGFGSGAVPIAPGTFGTLFAIPFFIVLAHLHLWAYGLFLLIAIIFASWVSDHLSKQIGIHDFGGMNIDEFVGYWVTMFAIPATWYWILLGFILFRIFDIWKPQPIRWLDKNIPGGFGMILDDVVAGVFSNIILQLLLIGLAFFK